MAWRFAGAGEAARLDRVMRFHPRYWHINFPRPMMASVITLPDGDADGVGSLQLDAVFYRRDDLAGLIWDSADTLDHPLTSYATDRDYSGCVLSFRWISTGVMPLDAVNGPVLTLEGRDAAGEARSWYVRLWNYVDAEDPGTTPGEARITLDFDDLAGGWDLETEADPVDPRDIDRMFISLVPPEYDGTDALLDAPAEGRVTLADVKCTGPRSRLPIGGQRIGSHGMAMATGYDDSYNITPERMVRNIHDLGYRGPINHYLGMSHYYRLERGAGGLTVTTGPEVLNRPCATWHRALAEQAAAWGFELIFSLSYELFAAVCPEDWSQRAENGDRALTGWEPPSTILSPAHPGAMAYLQQVARAFTRILVQSGQRVRFQIGEPWWWIEFVPPYRIFLYDAHVTAALGADSVSIGSMRDDAMSAAQTRMLDRAGEMLAASTAALHAAVRDEAPEAERLMLIYLPTILDPLAPEARRANVPLAWARPAFDTLQLEDYDWVQEGRDDETAAGIAAATARLGYPIGEQHYFTGFVRDPADAATFWPRIDAAAEAARARGTGTVFYWALPQVIRDGFVHARDRRPGLRRGISPGFAEAIASGSFHPVLLVRLDWPGGEQRLHSNAGDLAWQGQAWRGLGKFGRVTVPNETLTGAARRATLSLYGVPEDLLGEIDRPLRGRVGEVWIGATSRAGGGALIDDPLLVYAGTMDSTAFRLGVTDDRGVITGTTSVVQLDLVSGPPLRRLASLTHSYEDQRMQHPDDTAGRHITNAATNAQVTTWPE